MRPKNAKFWTTGDVATWIADNVPLDRIPAEERVDPQWAIKAALWFWAFRQAEGFNDYRRKDFASLIVEGMKPLTYRDMSRELKDCYVAEDGVGIVASTTTRLEISDALEAELRDFYGMKGKA